MPENFHGAAGGGEAFQFGAASGGEVARFGAQQRRHGERVITGGHEGALAPVSIPASVPRSLMAKL